MKINRNMFYYILIVFIFGVLPAGATENKGTVTKPAKIRKKQNFFRPLRRFKAGVPKPAQENLAEYCPDSYKKDGECPKNVCFLGCYGGTNYEDCDFACQPKICIEISAKDCPMDTCQILTGCDDTDVCYFRNETATPKCGGLAYIGGVECCEGFIKRCGIEFFNGSCDMSCKNSIQCAPMCIPCGNGICNQFENRCNCPEDCL